MKAKKTMKHSLPEALEGEEKQKGRKLINYPLKRGVITAKTKSLPYASFWRKHLAQH